MIKLVVFDMAGTTVDEDNVVYKTVRAAINAAGFDFTLEQVLAAGAGKEKLQAIRDVLDLAGSPHDDRQAREIFASFQQQLQTAYQQLAVRQQPGASNAFARLKQHGIHSVLNTGYDRATAEGLVDKIGWQVGNEIAGLVTASDVSRGRPHPDMIVKAMELVGVSEPSAVAKVGDSAIDIEEGHNATCGLTFGITTGAQTAAQLLTANPTAVVGSLEELCDWVLQGAA